MFKNRNFLFNVDVVKAFSHLFDSGSRGLYVQVYGDSNDLGRVGLATRAAAKILS